MKSPSEKQIELADDIAYILNLDFPMGSSDFTAQAYWKFIKTHLEDYKITKASNIYYDEDTLYDFCANDVWCEYY